MARKAAREVALAPVTAVRIPARAAASIGRYWQAERQTLRQGFTALSVSVPGSLLAGLTLGAMTGRLERFPGLLVMMPAVIGMRGSIFGALGSRLGTSIHAGMFRVSLERKGLLFQNAFAATALSMIQSIVIALAARALTVFFSLPSAPLGDYLVISLLAGIGSGFVILALTIVLARVAFRRSWDLDTVAAPIITFLGDVVTLPALFLASFAAGEGILTDTTAFVLSALSVVVFAVAAFRGRVIARRIVRESVLVLTLTAFISLLAGIVAEHELQRLLALPALVVLLPPFIGSAGALGGIVAARLTSKLHLGAVRPRLIPDRVARLDLSLAAPFAIGAFTFTGIAADLIATLAGYATPGLGTMVLLSLIAGLLTTIGSAAVAYAAAVASFRFRLDPDNHGIPLVTSSIDFLGTACLVGTIVLLKVG